MGLIKSSFKFFGKFSKKQVILGAVILLALITTSWFIFPKPKSEQVLYVSVKRADIQSSVSASGSLTGKESANLKFKSSGKLAFLNVSEGDSVWAGQVLAGLDTQDLSINLQQAQNNLRSVQASLDKILDDIHLFQYGNGGFANVSTKNETETQRQLRTNAEVAKDNAFDSVKAAQRAFQDTTLVSPISGIVAKVSVVAGQVVSPAEVIAQVINTNEIYFDADVDEADIGKISLDQKAQVSLDAYPDKTFEGTVAEILPQTETSTSGATTVTVRINLGNPQINFVSGLNGDCSIVLSEAKNVFVIPQEVIKDDGTVIIKSGKGYKSVKVEAGIVSDTGIEVKSGLKEGDQVVVNPASVKGV